MKLIMTMKMKTTQQQQQKQPQRQQKQQVEHHEQVSLVELVIEFIFNRVELFHR